jgi:hypothetical protein
VAGRRAGTLKASGAALDASSWRLTLDVLAGLGSIAGDNVRFENNTVINAAKTGQAVFRAAPNEYKTQPRNVLLKNLCSDSFPSLSRVWPRRSGGRPVCA